MGKVMGNVTANFTSVARNVEVYIFGAFGTLCLAACLSGPANRAAPALSAGVASEVELAQPALDAQMPIMEPMYVVYVVGKRLSAAEKRAMRVSAG